MAYFNSRRKPAEEVINTEAKGQNATYSIAKVFGYMFLWLLITAAVCIGLSPVFKYILNNDVNEEFYMILLGVLIVSVLVVLVLTFVIQFVFLRKGKSILVPAIIYSIAMGVMLSSFTLFIDWYLLGITFAITAALFGIMALIGLLSKGKLTGLAIAGMGLFIGALMMSGFMLIVMFAFPDYYQPFYWIISLAILCGVVLVTIYDISRIKVLAKRGELTKNLSLYLGFSLYCDFLYIFIQILEFVLKATGNSSRS